MARFIPLGEIREILRGGEFDQLIEGLEDVQLECKGAPYQLEDDRQKMELAKDVSALANVKGGELLLGVRTEKDPAHAGDEIKQIRCFGRNLADVDQYNQILTSWIYPPIKGLEVEWHPNKANPAVGIISISVPEEASRDKPYLVVKSVDEEGRVFGSLVGYFERWHDRVQPFSAQTLRELIKDGSRNSEIIEQLQDLQVAVGNLREERVRPDEVNNDDILDLRVGQARTALEYQEKPTIFLTAQPIELVTFPNLFRSKQDPLVQLLENPPRLREAGFGVGSNNMSTILAAELRRNMAGGMKSLDIWKDGSLIFVAAGDGWHLCWGMDSDPENGLRINNLALAETIFLFCKWAIQVYQHANPIPNQLRFSVGLLDMTINNRPCKLPPHRPSRFFLGDAELPAPNSSHTSSLQITNNQDTNPEVIAASLLEQVYAWFGFDVASIPYIAEGVEPPRINPDLIIGKQT